MPVKSCKRTRKAVGALDPHAAAQHQRGTANPGNGRIVDTLFFVASKIVWALIRPETWLVLGLAAAFVLFRRRPGIARGLIGVLLVLTVTLGYLPVGSYLIRGLENRYPANPPVDRIDGIPELDSRLGRRLLDGQ